MDFEALRPLGLEPPKKIKISWGDLCDHNVTRLWSGAHDSWRLWCGIHEGWRLQCGGHDEWRNYMVINTFVQKIIVRVFYNFFMQLV